MNGRLKKQIKNTLEELKNEVTTEGKEALVMLERSFGELRQEMSRLKSRMDLKEESSNSLSKSLVDQNERNRKLVEELRTTKRCVGEWEQNSRKAMVAQTQMIKVLTEFVEDALDKTFPEQTKRLSVSSAMTELAAESDQRFLQWLIATYRSLEKFSEYESNDEEIRCEVFGTTASFCVPYDSDEFFFSMTNDESELSEDLKSYLLNCVQLHRDELLGVS